VLKLKLDISRQDILLLAVAWLLIILIIFGAARNLNFITSLENSIKDFYSSAMLSTNDQNEEIVLVTITEDTLSQFDYRSPIDRQHLNQVITYLIDAGAKIIAIDILLDQKTEAEKDAELIKTLESSPIPIVSAWAGLEDNLTRSQASFLNLYTKNLIKGYVGLGVDEADGIIRWIEKNVQTEPKTVLSFPLSIADAIGVNLPTERYKINWTLGPDSTLSPFKKYESHFVSVLPSKWFENKIILIGADLPHSDRHMTPLRYNNGYGASDMAGIEIHAHALATVLSGELNRNSSSFISILVTILSLLMVSIISLLEIMKIVKTCLLIALFTSIWATGALLEYHSINTPPLFSASLGMITLMLYGIYICERKQRRYKKFISNAFSRYMSQELLTELQRNSNNLKLGGEKREVSIIFTDIAGFTKLSENIPAEELVRALNSYLEGMSEIILRHGGMIDKYIGDAIMVIFNAPKNQEEHSIKAVRCAIELDLFAQKYCRETKTEGLDWGITRIGVHTATAIVGNIGGPVRFDYTSIGDAVNTAARLEGINKVFGTRLCISKNTVSNCPELFFRPIGELILKGKSKALKIYEPVSGHYPQRDLYEKAYKYLESGRNHEAIKVFTSLIANNRSDALVQYHISRIKNGESGVLIKAKDK
tara:strand:- start:1427 stop:3382 length:1956 start_codon:yes stop_codon:yes gene_type:complete